MATNDTLRSTLSVELRPGDKLLVDGGVVVTMEHKTGRAARLRISAPRSVRISTQPAGATALTPDRQASETAPVR
jgi:hypothetical protein